MMQGPELSAGGSGSAGRRFCRRAGLPADGFAPLNRVCPANRLDSLSSVFPEFISSSENGPPPHCADA
jgi:hypothetical protein